MVSYPSLTITTTKFAISQSKAVPTVLITHDKELLSCSRHNIMVTWPNLGTASSLSGLYDLALGILAWLGIVKIRTMARQNLNKIKWDFVLPLNLKEYKLFYVRLWGWFWILWYYHRPLKKVIS